jgi:integrase
VATIDAYTYKDTERWRVRYRYAGQRKTRARFHAREDAQDWADRLEAARSAGQIDDFLAGRLDDRPELTLEELVIRYLAEDADYELPNGLAKSTYKSYLSAANVHILPRIGSKPASVYASAAAPRAFRSELAQAKVPTKAADRAWKVLSSSLSWAARESIIEANGCLLVGQTKTRRRSGRADRGPRRRQAAGAVERRGAAERAWALEPDAVAALSWHALTRTNGRLAWFAERDAAIIDLSYGLGCRPQELFGATFGDVASGHLHIEEVLSVGELTGAKTLKAHRAIPLMPWTEARLTEWRKRLRGLGQPAGTDDFIIPGVEDGHLSEAQQHSWSQDQFKPIAKLVAKADKDLAYVTKSTPYALRRGMISLRLLCGGRLWDPDKHPNPPANDPSTIADDHGTSTKVLFEHYARSMQLRSTQEGTPDDLIRASFEALVRGGS